MVLFFSSYNWDIKLPCDNLFIVIFQLCDDTPGISCELDRVPGLVFAINSASFISKQEQEQCTQERYRCRSCVSPSIIHTKAVVATQVAHIWFIADRIYAKWGAPLARSYTLVHKESRTKTRCTIVNMYFTLIHLAYIIRLETRLSLPFISMPRLCNAFLVKQVFLRPLIIRTHYTHTTRVGMWPTCPVDRKHEMENRESWIFVCFMRRLIRYSVYSISKARLECPLRTLIKEFNSRRKQKVNHVFIAHILNKRDATKRRRIERWS